MNSTRTISTVAALFAAAALVAGAVSPAVAMSNDPAQEKKQDDQDAKNAKKRYCIQGPTTGTMLPKRVCHTRAEWLEQGFDPLKKDS